MIEFRERDWSHPYDSGDCLLTPLPLEYDSWFCRNIYGKISFYSLQTLYPDKDRYCVLLGISHYFRGFFLIKGFAVADTSHTWKRILADSIQGEYTRAVWCLATWSSFFVKTLRPMSIWRSRLLVSKCHGYCAQFIEAGYGNQGLQWNSLRPEKWEEDEILCKRNCGA
jgi:hypothetical protein